MVRLAYSTTWLPCNRLPVSSFNKFLCLLCPGDVDELLTLQC